MMKYEFSIRVLVTFAPACPTFLGSKVWVERRVMLTSSVGRKLRLRKVSGILLGNEGGGETEQRRFSKSGVIKPTSAVTPL